MAAIRRGHSYSPVEHSSTLVAAIRIGHSYSPVEHSGGCYQLSAKSSDDVKELMSLSHLILNFGRYERVNKLSIPTSVFLLLDIIEVAISSLFCTTHIPLRATFERTVPYK